MMQETEEEDVELVGGGRRGPSSTGISSDSKVLKRGLVSFAAVIISLNLIVFTLGIKYSQDYTPPPVEDPDSDQWTSFRLPTTTRPLHYIMGVHADMDHFQFVVEENIQIEISNNSTQTIILNGRDLQASSAVLYSQDGRNITSKSVDYNATNAFVLFHFGEELSEMLHQGHSIFNLTFHCNGTIGDVARGFYRSSYLENGEKKWLAVTDFEPEDARSAFISFDEPAYKATFTISVAADATQGWFAISNMNELSTIQRQYANGSHDGYTIHQFATSPPMPTYLVCYVVSRFGHVSFMNGTVPVRVFAPPLLIEQARFAAETGSKIVDAFGNYFGIPYALPKLDMIALPDFTSGAMENWGLITYRIEALLWNPNSSSLAAKQSISMIISHELAHQWFGNLVTMKWWDNVWLNEGFASFIEYLGVDLIHSDWKLWSQFIPMDRSVAMDLDSLTSSHPLVVPIETSGEIVQQFDAISYSKGASVLRMLKEKMDQDAKDSFQKGIQSYLTKHKYGNADSDELWSDLVEETGQTSVTPFMKSWTEQVGYPLVTATIKSDGIHADLEQHRFLFNSQTSDNTSQLWEIPLTTQRPDASLTPYTYNQKNMEIPVGPSWSVLNVDGRGYYRVRYDRILLGRIIQQWKDDHLALSEETRSSVLSDAFALNLAQIESIDYPLSLVEHMKGERDYVPWWTTLSALSGIRSFVDADDFYDTYQRFIRTTLAPALSDLTFRNVNENLTESHSTQLLRPVALLAGIAADDETVINEGYRLFQQMKLKKSTNTSVDLNPAIYNAAAARGSSEVDYQWIRRSYLNETSPTEKTVLLSALCKFQLSHQIRSTLSDSLNSDIIKPKDVQSVMVSVARSSPMGRDLTWSFFKENFEKLKAQFGDAPFIMDGIIKRVCSLFSRTQEKVDVEAFFARNSLDKGSRSIAQALEQIEINKRWREKNVEPLRQWLSQWAERNPVE